MPVPSLERRTRKVVASGHTYNLVAMPKGPGDRRRGGPYLYGCWRDHPILWGDIGRWFSSKRALLNAYPSLRGKLTGWP